MATSPDGDYSALNDLVLTDLPIEIVLLVLDNVDIMYGPAVESVCRNWHCLWDGRHHFIDDDLLLWWTRAGHKRLLEWAFDSGWIRRGSAIATLAAKEDHVDIVQWCFERGLKVRADAKVAMVRRGHLSLLERLNGRGPLRGHCLVVAAAKGGHLDLVQSLIPAETMTTTCQESKDVCAAAAKKEHKHILEWALSVWKQHHPRHWWRGPWDKKTCRAAAKAGNLELLQWLRANGCPWDTETIQFAAHIGRSDIVEWAHANGCPWDKWACASAAYSGNLKLLQWLRENGCPWNECTQLSAASKGHLHVLDWLHAQGCPEDYEHAALSAAGSGRVAVLDWLYAAGWQITGRGDDCVGIAACEGHIGALSWFHDKRCPAAWIVNGIKEAASAGRIDIIKWARARGYEWNKGACKNAAEEGRLGTLRWLRRNECPWNGKVCEAAARHGHRRVLEWSVAHGCPWDPRVCLALAKRFAIRSSREEAKATVEWIESQMGAP
jgi:hypothetical protein